MLTQIESGTFVALIKNSYILELHGAISRLMIGQYCIFKQLHTTKILFFTNAQLLTF
jgi:hypothetical protein